MSELNWLHQLNTDAVNLQNEDERFSLFMQSIVMDFGYLAGNEASSANDTHIFQSDAENYGYIVEWECLAE
jgi:hypothetical protein